MLISYCFFRDIKASLFISELEKGKKLAQFMMQKLPHIIPFAEVGFLSSLQLKKVSLMIHVIKIIFLSVFYKTYHVT